MTFPESSSFIANNKLELSSFSMDEYVIVEQSDEIRYDDRSKECDCGSGLVSDDADDASYDYCEDACPNDSEEEEEDDNDDGNSVASLESEAAHKENVILSVPSGLMKHLDEAHAAAKLACSSAGGVGAEDASLTEEMEDMQKSGGPELEHKSSTGAVVIEMTTAEPRTKPQVKSASSVATLSRTSNKKRRKQLKLVKKAQAAASAAQALSARAAANAKANKGKKVAASPVSSSSSLSSRKVANMAVACALETMASYRKEVICSSVS